MNCLYRIYRANKDSNPSWQVRINKELLFKDLPRIQRNFADRQFDYDCEKSLLAAIKFRDAHIGPYLHRIEKTKPKGRVKYIYRQHEQKRWGTYYRDRESGKRKSVFFLDKVYGSAQISFVACLEFRRILELELNGYSEIDIDRDSYKYASYNIIS